MRRCREARGALNELGVSVAESLVALSLLFLLLTGARMVFAGHAALTRHVADAAQRAETLRILRTVLASEIRAGLAGRDWWITAGDSVSLRAFRGAGIVCGSTGATAVLQVRARGLRHADPEKDSVLVLGRDGQWRVAALIARASAPDSVCRGLGQGESQRWTVDRMVPSATLVRYFERGSYHIADHAFRYRRGSSGRQPLTVLLVDESSTLRAQRDGSVILDLGLKKPGSSEKTLRRRLSIWPRDGGS